MTKDKKWITISLNSKTSSEVRLIPSQDPWSDPILVQPRIPGLEYYVEHCRGNLIIVTNDREAHDYKLVQTIPARTDDAGGQGCGRDTWLDLLVPEPGCKIEDIDVFAEHIAVYQRTSRGQQLRVLGIEGGRDLDSCQHGAGSLCTGQPGGNKPSDTAQAQDQRALEAGKSDASRRTGLVMHSVSCGFPHETLDEAPSRGSFGNFEACQRRGGQATESSFGGQGRVLKVNADTIVTLPNDEIGTCIQPGANCDYHGSTLRLSLSSPLSPWTVVDVSLRAESRALQNRSEHAVESAQKQVEIVRQCECEGFEPRDFICRQEWAVSRDGTQVSPIARMRACRRSFCLALTFDSASTRCQ
jgi:hypothetical protein